VNRNLLTFEEESACVVRGNAVDALADFGPSGAHEPGQRKDLAAPHGKGDILEEARPRQAFYPEDLFADGCMSRWKILRDFSAHHALYKPRLFEPLDVPRGNVVTVAEHGDPLREPVHVLDPVRDEDDGDALGAKAFCDAVEVLALAARKRGGGFVHDENFCVHGKRLGYLDDLLLGDGEASHRGRGTEVRVEALKQGLGLLPQFAPVYLPCEGVEALVSQKDILEYRKVGEACDMLIDCRNAEPLRIEGASEANGLPIEQYFAFVGVIDAGDDFDERGLTGTVFAHDRVDLSGFELKMHIFQRLHAREKL
jgi:hypothetical protein